MTFGTGNVRSLYRSGLFATVARELAMYKSDLLGVQEVKWDKEGTVRVRDNFLYGKGNENHKLGKRFVFTLQNSITAKSVKFVRDRS
jgi:hypothetical protein